MSAHPTIKTPITGREALGELEDLGELKEPVQALVQFYRAFNGRDLALMAENWQDSPDIAMDNPLGGIKRGWPEIGAVYQRIFAGPGRVEVEFFDYTLHVSADAFYAVGRERGTFAAGNRKLELAIRTTRIFRRAQGRWRQVHHHGSIDDATLLGAYQQAVR